MQWCTTSADILSAAIKLYWYKMESCKACNTWTTLKVTKDDQKLHDLISHNVTSTINITKILLVVCSNIISILRHFQNIILYSVAYMTADNLQKSFGFVWQLTVDISGDIWILIHGLIYIQAETSLCSVSAWMPHAYRAARSILWIHVALRASSRISPRSGLDRQRLVGSASAYFSTAV